MNLAGKHLQESLTIRLPRIKHNQARFLLYTPSNSLFTFPATIGKKEAVMKKGWIVPPECCVIIEIEQGASLGYRKAVLLNEIKALGSLEKAAKTSRLNAEHARDLVLEMNQDFSQPLIIFHGNPYDCDQVQLSRKGEDVARSYWQQFEPVWLSIVEERSRHY